MSKQIVGFTRAEYIHDCCQTIHTIRKTAESPISSQVANKSCPKSAQISSTMADKDKAKIDLGLLEEDDEFEEFPAEG